MTCHIPTKNRESGSIISYITDSCLISIFLRSFILVFSDKKIEYFTYSLTFWQVFQWSTSESTLTRPVEGETKKWTGRGTWPINTWVRRSTDQVINFRDALNFSEAVNSHGPLNIRSTQTSWRPKDLEARRSRSTLVFLVYLDLVFLFNKGLLVLV